MSELAMTPAPVDEGASRALGQDGDFDALVSQNATTVLRYLARRTDPDTAAEVWQETCLVAWRRTDQVPVDEAGQRAWLVAVARRVLANHRRQGKRRSGAVDQLAQALRSRATPATSSADPVGDAMDRLPEADRELLRLVYWDGFDLNQAATVLEISPAACRKRAQRARDALRADLAGLVTV